MTTVSSEDKKLHAFTPEEDHLRKIRAGKILIEPPQYGEVILTYHNGELRYVEERTKAKVDVE